MPEAPPPPGQPTRASAPADPAFGTLVARALAERARSTTDGARRAALDELTPQSICLLAAGLFGPAERRELSASLIRLPWALGRVSALVRAARAHRAHPLAVRLLAAARSGSFDPWGIAADALREAQVTVPGGEDDGSLARAARLLSEGRRREACEVLAPFADSAAEGSLLLAVHRAAASQDAEVALAHLLEGVPDGVDAAPDEPG
ncbi:MAG: hypothetical protein D6731_18295 [Planctomycetota bacterium]|nr:MAG: hypothetical protein D6731_18295 [Planctomycetota bacterium]